MKPLVQRRGFPILGIDCYGCVQDLDKFDEITQRGGISVRPQAAAGGIFEGAKGDPTAEHQSNADLVDVLPAQNLYAHDVGSFAQG